MAPELYERAVGVTLAARCTPAWRSMQRWQHLAGKLLQFLSHPARSSDPDRQAITLQRFRVYADIGNRVKAAAIGKRLTAPGEPQNIERFLEPRGSMIRGPP